MEEAIGETVFHLVAQLFLDVREKPVPAHAPERSDVREHAAPLLACQGAGTHLLSLTLYPMMRPQPNQPYHTPCPLSGTNPGPADIHLAGSAKA
jgi:hypothetical protein